MSNLIRFEPFSDLARFNPFMDVDDMLNRIVPRTLLRSAWETEPQMRMDIKEQNGEYCILAEIPGVKKEDIHVTVDRNRVSINAEVKQMKDVKEDERLICCERCYGTTSRSFNLAEEVDQSKVQAKYNNGILELTLPKKSGMSRKEITVA